MASGAGATFWLWQYGQRMSRILRRGWDGRHSGSAPTDSGIVQWEAKSAGLESRRDADVFTGKSGNEDGDECAEDVVARSPGALDAPAADRCVPVSAIAVF